MNTLFPDTLRRSQYLVRWLIFIVLIGIVAALLIPLPNFVGIPKWSPPLVIVPLSVLRIPCIDIPRIRSIGSSPWLLLLFIVPLANFIMQLLLFLAPPKNATA